MLLWNSNGSCCWCAFSVRGAIIFKSLLSAFRRIQLMSFICWTEIVNQDLLLILLVSFRSCLFFRHGTDFSFIRNIHDYSWEMRFYWLRILCCSQQVLLTRLASSLSNVFHGVSVTVHVWDTFASFIASCVHIIHGRFSVRSTVNASQRDCLLWIQIKQLGYHLLTCFVIQDEPMRSIWDWYRYVP